MDGDWRRVFGIFKCTEICDGAGTLICDGLPSTCSSCVLWVLYDIMITSVAKRKLRVFFPLVYIVCHRLPTLPK